MLAAALIAFREGLEAALIVGIVFGYLKKSGQTAHNRSVWAGVITAIAVSIGLAVIIQIVGAELEGQAEQIFEGITMLLAVVVLTWMIFWMRYQSRTLKPSLERNIQQAVSKGHGRGLMAVAFLAVIREGVETALLLSAAVFAASGQSTLIGILAGLGVAALVGYLIYASTVRLNLRVFFNVTATLLLVFAAGLLAHSIHEFQEAGLLMIVSEHLWDTSYILPETSTVGLMLQTLVGYNANPSLLEVVGYWLYWGFVLFGMRWVVDRRIARRQATLQTA